MKTAAGTRMIDSDFRRGSDVGKAVASGAKAVMLERAPLYGLAAGGEGDVSEVIDIFKDEIDRTLALVERSYSGEFSMSPSSPKSRFTLSSPLAPNFALATVRWGGDLL